MKSVYGYLTVAAKKIEETFMDLALGPVPAGKPGPTPEEFEALVKLNKRMVELEGELAVAKRHNRRLYDELAQWQSAWKTLNSLNTNSDTGFSLGGK